MVEPVGHRWEYRDRSTKDPQSFKVCVTLLILLFTLTREFLHPVNFKDTFFFYSKYLPTSLGSVFLFYYVYES